MSPKNAGSDDWMSAPVGGITTDATKSAPTESSPTEATSASEQESRYKSSFANDLSKDSRSTVYPAGGTGSDGRLPGESAPMDPGPATSIGLGSSATGTQAAPKGKANGVRRTGNRRPRRAKLQIRHIDPWSTLKLSLVVSIAFFFVWMIAVGLLYAILNSMGVFDSINSLFSELNSGAKATNVVSIKVVLFGAAILGAINIVLFTALCTVGSYIYNLCADLAGGLEITLAERS